MGTFTLAILKLLADDAKHGEKLTPSGARLISPAPEIAPAAWHHIAFPPLVTSEVRKLEVNLHQQLPTQFEQFLCKFNGISLFGNRLNIWGKRRSWNRTGDDVWQPFDIVDHNASYERPPKSPYQVVYFGSTDHGTNWVFFRSDGTVGKSPREEFWDVGTWRDFDTWGTFEMNRITDNR